MNATEKVGPYRAIRRGLEVRRFENIHVYDFMCAVLGLQPATNDGDPAVTRDMLRSSR